MFASAGWSWHGPRAKVTGPAWGGCLEIIDFHLRADRYLLAGADYEGAVLFLETSEEMPSAEYAYRVLMGMGERGLLQRFGAIVWGRPQGLVVRAATCASRKGEIRDRATRGNARGRARIPSGGPGGVRR